MDTPFPALEDFKREHLPLLERHQLHLLGVAERFRGLPAGPDFEERLDQLRAEVERERHSLELGAREAWSRARAELTKGALVAGSTAMVTGLAVLRGFSLFELLSTVVPAAAAGLSTTAASAWEEVRRARRAKVHDLAYLFAAQSWLGPSRSPRR